MDESVVSLPVSDAPIPAAKPWERSWSPPVDQIVEPAAVGSKPWERYTTGALKPWERKWAAPTVDEVKTEAAPEPGVLDQALEYGKSVVSGALNTAASMIKGQGVASAYDPTMDRHERGLFEGYNAQLPDIPSMSDEAYQKWRSDAMSLIAMSAQNPVLNAPNHTDAIMPVLKQAELIRSGKAPAEKIQYQQRPDITDTEAYKTGAELDQWTRENIPVDPSVRDSLGGKVASGLGSTVPFIATAVIGGPMVSAISGMSASTAEAVDKAVAEGATRDQIANIARQGMFPGATEAVPIETLLDRIPVPAAGKFLGAVGRVLEQAAIEGGQEAVQQAWQNIIARFEYKPDQDVFEGVAEAALVGSLVGGTMKAPVEAAKIVTGKQEQEQPAEGTRSETVEAADLPSEPPVTQDGGGEVVSPLDAPPSSATPEERAILRRTSMPDEDIDAMSDEERAAKVAEAISAGVKINGAMVRAAEQYRAPVVESLPESVPAPEERPIEMPSDQPVETNQPVDTRGAAEKLIQDYQQRKALDRQMNTEAEQRVQSVAPELSATVLRGLYEDSQPAAMPRPETTVDTRPDPRAIASRQIARYRGREAEADQSFAGVQQDLEAAVRSSMAENEREDAAVDRALGAPLSAVVSRSVYEDTKGDGSRLSPKRVELPGHIDAVADRVNVEPSEAQKAAGNYQKSHIKVSGLDITIENPKGTTRSGTSTRGTTWSVDMPAHYGYVKRTSGADGDQVDVYVGDNPASRRVYVVDQRDPATRRFDEHKAIMGVSSVSEARDLYARAFSDRSGMDRIGAITPMSVSEFKAWLRDGDTTRPLRMGKGIRTSPEGFPVDLKGSVKKPDSLIEFLARKGGVREDHGELSALGLRDRKTGFVVGAGPMIRSKGMHPDKAREAAAEAGYLPMESSLADFYDALDADSRSGRQQFSLYDQDWGMAWREGQGGEQREADEASARSTEQEVRDILTSYGFPIEGSDRFIAETARAMETSLPFEEAVESAYRALGQEISTQKPELLDIPFFGDDSEVQPGTAPAYGTADRAVGEQVARASEIRTEEARADRPVRGEGRQEVASDGSREDGERGDREGTAERPRAVAEETGADNKPQLIIPGAERASNATMAQRGADAPLKPKAPQKDPGGLFSDERDQGDFLDLSIDPDERDTFVPEALASFSENDDFFANPVSKARTLRGVAEEVVDGAKLQGPVDLTEEDRHHGADRKTLIKTTSGQDFYVYESRPEGGSPGEVWIDVSRLDEGTGGSQIYAAIANYAHNTGKVFIGDPAGLSDVALRRRTEAMISSALKFGTTEHLRPHPRQVSGDKALGVPAIKWTDGDDIGNLQSMIDASIASIEAIVPEISSARYDFESRTFRTDQGERLSDGAIRTWLADQRAREAAIGISTIKRALLVKALSRAPGGARPRLLAEALERGAQHVSGPLRGIHYARRAESVPGRETGLEADRGVASRLTEVEQKRLVEIVRRAAGVDPAFADSIKVRSGTEGLAAWGKADQDATAAGAHDSMRDIITLALDTPSERAGKVAYHESFHRLQNLFLRNAERKLLKANEARFRKMIADKGEYSAATVEKMSQKEVEAEAFGIWADRKDKGEANGVHIGIRKVWQNIRDLLARIGNYLRGRGYQTVDDIFGKARSGEIAARPRQETKSADKDYSIVDRAPGEPIKPPAKPKTRFSDRLALASKFVADKVKSKGGKYDRLTEGDEETLADLTTRKVLDYLDPVLKMQQKVGADLNDLSDAHLTARLAEGTIRHELHQVDEKYVQPAIKELAAVGATEKDLSEYMYAMHAPERNRVAGLRNEESSDLYKAVTDPSIRGASGMSTNEAKAILADLAKDRQKFMGIRRAASHIRAMLDDGLKRQLKAGLINKATYERLTQQWQHYVPLRSESDQDGTGGGMPKKSRGFDVRGDEFKGATGRYTKADNVVTYAINAAEQSIIRAEKNKAATAALRFINQFDPQGESLAKVYWSDEPDKIGDITKAPPVYKRTLDKDGKVVNRRVNAFQMKDDVLAAKVGGKTYYMQFSDPKVGLALKKMTFLELGAAMKVIKSVSNWQSLINTRANPAFVPINMIRDIQTGAVIALSKDFKTGEIVKMVGNIPNAWGALWRDARGKPGSGKWDKVVADFKANGGKISFDQYNTVEQTAKKIQKDLQRATSQGAAGKTWHGFIDLVESLNDTIENGIRVTIFNAAIEQGRTPKRAAFLARDLTVDFQKKGEITPQMNALYTFFNASVQGNVNFARALYKSRKIKVAMGALIMAGYAQHVMNLALAGDDDDGENAYLKMLRNEPWTFERNIVLFLPNSKQYIKIPLGFGMNAFWHLGVQGGAVTTGDKGFLDATLDSTRVGFDAFNPLGSGGWVGMALPSIIDPVWELGTNENFSGNPIYPQENQYDPAPPPKSEQAFKSTSPVFRWGAETLNKISGGNKVLPGAVDVYPDSLEYLWGWFSGGIGRFVSQTVESAQRGVDLDFEAKKTPFIRSFYGEVDDAGKRAEYFRQREKTQYVKGKMKEFQESGDSDGLKDFITDHKQDHDAIRAFEVSEKLRRKLNKQRRALEKHSASAETVKRIDEQELEIMNRARKAYFEAGQ